MHNYIYNETKIHYAIVRMNLDTSEYEYFNGCHKFGKDADGIVIVRNTAWDKEFHINRLSPSLDYADRTLKGILKYDYDYKYYYFICECKINTSIDANAPIIM